MIGLKGWVNYDQSLLHVFFGTVSPTKSASGMFYTIWKIDDATATPPRWLSTEPILANANICMEMSYLLYLLSPWFNIP